MTAATYVHLGLNPGSDDVGLGGELAPQSLVSLLSGHLLLEHLVSERNEVLHLRGVGGWGVVNKTSRVNERSTTRTSSRFLSETSVTLETLV